MRCNAAPILRSRLLGLGSARIPECKVVQRATEFDDSAYVRELAVKVIDGPTGKAITNATAVLNIADDQSSFFFGEKSTDTNGAVLFVFPKQETVALTLQIKAEGHALETIAVARNSTGAIPATIEARLVPGAALGGFVKDSAGSAVSGAEVVVYRLVRTGANEYSRIDLYSATTDAGGKWQAPQMPAEDSSLHFAVTCADYKPAAFSLSAGEGGVLQLARADLLAAKATMALQPGIRVTGTVVETNEAPVAIAEAILQTADGSYRRVVPVEQGKFSFVELEPREGQLMVTATNYAPQVLPLKIAPGLQALKVVLTRGLPLQVAVRDQDQRPVAGAAVFLEASNQSRLLIWKTETDSNGRFVWTNAPAGAVKCEITSRDYAGLRTALHLPATNELSVVMRKHPRLKFAKAH